MNGIVVLSLFDGMSCGQIALKEAGIKVKQYYSCEIDKYAIQVTQKNFPDTVQLGDVTKVFFKDGYLHSANGSFYVGAIDLLIGGSPCQGFSFAGKQLAFDDPRSKLFFEFVRLKSECQPNYFMLENVKMKKEFELVISKYMGVAPIEINSALVSAQNRVRLYWTNIANEPYGFFGDMVCNIPQPKDKGILLKDILESDVAEKYYLSEKMLQWFGKIGKKPVVLNGKSGCFTAGGNSGGLHSDMTLIREPIQLNGSTESGGQQPYQQNRVYDIDGISPALMAQMSCGSHAILIPEATKKGYVEVKPGECFDFENPKSETRRVRKMEEKSNCLMAKETDFMQYTQQGRIRRLTPTECERLQTAPDGCTDCVSDTQRYRMLGNGWTVAVVSYIFSFIKLNKRHD